MTKFKEYYKRMIESNKEAFERFGKIHLKYSIDPEANQENFNQEGEKILSIIRAWENKLCNQSEKAGYASYTGRLSEKFREEVRRNFPKIDCIGLMPQTTKNNEEEIFPIKRIRLS